MPKFAGLVGSTQRVSGTQHLDIRLDMVQKWLAAPGHVIEIGLKIALATGLLSEVPGFVLDARWKVDEQVDIAIVSKLVARGGPVEEITAVMRARIGRKLLFKFGDGSALLRLPNGFLSLSRR